MWRSILPIPRFWAIWVRRARSFSDSKGQHSGQPPIIRLPYIASETKLERRLPLAPSHLDFNARLSLTGIVRSFVGANEKRARRLRRAFFPYGFFIDRPFRCSPE